MEDTTDVTADNKILASWTELRALMDAIEPDLMKNARGTVSAGVRARKGLRTLKTKVSELVKTTIALDKQNSSKST